MVENDKGKAGNNNFLKLTLLVPFFLAAFPMPALAGKVSDLNDALLLGQEKRVVELLNQGADPALLTKAKAQIGVNEDFISLPKNSSALHVLAISPYEFSNEMVAKLVVKGAEVDEQDGNGSTAILLAASKGKYQLVRFLLALGANPNLENNLGQTPLLLAALPYGEVESDKPINWSGRLHTVSFLLYKKAQPGSALEGHSILYHLLLFLAEHPGRCDNEDNCKRLAQCLYINGIDDIPEVLELIKSHKTIPSNIAWMVKFDLIAVSLPTPIVAGIGVALLGAMCYFMPHIVSQ